MKKLILTFAVVGLFSFSACKKTTDGAKQDAANAANSVSQGAQQAGDAVASGAQQAGSAVASGAQQAGDAVGNAASTSTNAISDLLDGVPDFKNPQLTVFAKGYKAFYENYLKVIEQGNPDQVSQYQAEASKYQTQAETMLKSASTDDQVKWTKWTTKMLERINK